MGVWGWDQIYSLEGNVEDKGGVGRRKGVGKRPEDGYILLWETGYILKSLVRLRVMIDLGDREK